ncbi:MAG: hypothetical protein EPN39_08960 [Chitinophagaceae bacterium]|nr:MAG: hypothetical protein EPN39_08960 [Chitinophagaceae bacterium]
MENLTIHPPLSNVQAELLKLFPAEIPKNDLLEIRKVIAKFLLEKARDHADEVWDEKGYSDKRLMEILNKDRD